MALSDAQYIAFLVKAARRLNRELRLTNTTDEIVVNSSTGEMTSPTSPISSDLEDLLLLQAECLILQRNTNEDLEEGGAGVLIVDGEQTVDTRAVSSLRAAFLAGDHNPCGELKSAILSFKYNTSSGKLVY